MAKAYLIGGAPRTGKTTLTKRLIETHPTMAASTDAIRYVLRRVIEQKDEPDLFRLEKYTSNDPECRVHLQSSPLDVIEMQNKESATVWRSVADFVRSNIEDGVDVLIEGVAVLPELVAQLECEYSVVFLGNQSEQHFQTILQAARSNNNDWMHNLEDETIKAFAAFNQVFSKHIQQETTKHSMTYVEIRDDNFDTDLSDALRYLLQ